jgi:hypothetical protein
MTAEERLIKTFLFEGISDAGDAGEPFGEYGAR